MNMNTFSVHMGIHLRAVHQQRKIQEEFRAHYMDHFWWKTTNLGDGESAIKCAGQHDTLNSPC